MSRAESADGRLHVVLGAGPVGLTLADRLRREDRRVRVVTRSSNPDLPEGTEHRNARLEDPSGAISACKGADVVFGCVGMGYGHWEESWPPLMRGMLAGAGAAGARYVFMDDLYMYGPRDEPLRENMELTDHGAKPVVRAELTRIWRRAHERDQVMVTALRAPDFYGPLVRESMLGDLVFGRAMEGKPARLIGDPDAPHTFAYVPDIARALATLADASNDVYGQAWHVPSAPPVTLREAVERIYRAMDRKPRLSVAPGWLLRILGLFSTDLHELVEMRFQWDRPYRVDHSKFAARFWNDPTPFDRGVAETVAWWKGL